MRLASLAASASLAALVSAVACTRAAVPASVAVTPARLPAAVADSVASERLAPGVTLHRLVSRAAPWRAVVLDVDLTACTSLRAVKGGAGAAGRRTTGALLASLAAGLPASERALGAVNADFFLFAPPGVPVGAHVEGGVLVSGPVNRPVFAVAGDGRPWIGRLAVSATLRSPRGEGRVTSWNRPTRGVPGVVDARWGVPLDTTTRGPRWRLVPVDADAGGGARRFVAGAWPAERATVTAGDTLLLVEWGGSAPPVGEGDTITVTRTIAPDVREAVGGFPLLARDSVLSPTIDRDGAEGFRGLNPRTAVGVADGGRRVFLVVIDGRQPGVSIGMTTRETAALLLALGARDALNLDGGGSSALVVRRGDGDAARNEVVNHPSDAVGERAVANALAVTRGCAR